MGGATAGHRLVMPPFLALVLVGLVVCVVFLAAPASGCMLDGSSPYVVVGSNTYVCLVVAPLVWIAPGTYNNSGLYARSANTFKADEISSINIRQSFTDVDYNNDIIMQTFGIYPGPNTGVGITIESMGVLSYQRAYRMTLNNSRPVTFPLMMAIINVNKGKVQGIVWDDTECSWCASNKCASNTYDFAGHPVANTGKACFLDDAECNINRFKNGTIVSKLCQMTVFVVWTGTDSQGRYFRSAAARFSRLAAAQVAQVTDARKTTAASPQ